MSKDRKIRLPFIAAGLMGFTGVALGAFGAHALEDFLAERGSTATWETAVFYLLVHAVAALATGCASLADNRPRLWNAVAICWLVGAVFFSGSLFGLASGGPKWLGPITPIGGVSFLIGWALILRASFGNSRQ